MNVIVVYVAIYMTWNDRERGIMEGEGLLKQNNEIHVSTEEANENEVSEGYVHSVRITNIHALP